MYVLSTLTVLDCSVLKMGYRLGLAQYFRRFRPGDKHLVGE